MTLTVQKKRDTNSLQKRITTLVTQVSEGVFEREEIIAVALLGALCGQNTFLYGPPGTAKSLISRRIACAFHDTVYFEYLMNRFSTPEEIFGPVSIKELKEDHYVRKTNHYLPKAEFAFLDEIWKSSPAILNTLLTLINERIFRNGEQIENVPLKALIAASNETPSANQGLDALYDRFIIRLMVEPISQTKHFEHLINNEPTEASIVIDNNIVVKSTEWEEWRKEIQGVQLSPETLTIIHFIRDELVKNFDELKVYVSDRRWQRAAILIKASAFFNGRNKTNHSDAILLQHCLWTHEDNRKAVVDIVASAIEATGFNSDINLAELDREKESLDKEINKELFYSEDIYKTKTLNGKEYFDFAATFESANKYYHADFKKTVYIAEDKIKSTDKFHPIDNKGNEIKEIECQFDGQGSCHLKHDSRNHNTCNFTPKILFHRNDKKQDVNERLVKSLSDAVTKIRENLTTALSQVETKKIQYEKELASPFITSEKSQIAIKGIINQIKKIKLRIADCERLEGLCR